MAHDVFVSYSDDDRLVADKVCAALEGTGIRCWIHIAITWLASTGTSRSLTLSREARSWFWYVRPMLTRRRKSSERWRVP